MCSVSPAQSAGEICPALQLGPTPSEVPSGLGWSWWHRMEAGEIRKGRPEGPYRTEGAGEEQGRFPCPLEPRKPAGLQDESPTL